MADSDVEHFTPGVEEAETEESNALGAAEDLAASDDDEPHHSPAQPAVAGPSSKARKTLLVENTAPAISKVKESTLECGSSVGGTPSRLRKEQPASAAGWAPAHVRQFAELVDAAPGDRVQTEADRLAAMNPHMLPVKQLQPGCVKCQDRSRSHPMPFCGCPVLCEPCSRTLASIMKKEDPTPVKGGPSWRLSQIMCTSCK